MCSSGNNTVVNMHESGIPFEADGLMDKYRDKTQHHINFNMQSERDMS